MFVALLNVPANSNAGRITNADIIGDAPHNASYSVDTGAFTSIYSSGIVGGFFAEVCLDIIGVECEISDGESVLVANTDNSGTLLSGSYTLTGRAPLLGIETPSVLIEASLEDFSLEDVGFFAAFFNFDIEGLLFDDRLVSGLESVVSILYQGSWQRGEARALTPPPPVVDASNHFTFSWVVEDSFFTHGDLTIEVVVPEPTTLALFGLALAGLGFARRRVH